MEKTTTVYIDHWGGLQDDQGLFAKRIKDRLKGAIIQSTVFTYYDASYSGTNESSDDEPYEYIDGNEWEIVTIDAIKSADIIIPIVSADYMSWVSTHINDLFNKIIESDDKYLFPILYGPTNWSAIDWVVKSKLIQDDGRPITDYSADRVDSVINELVRTVNDIINRNSKISNDTVTKLEGVGSPIIEVTKPVSGFNEVFISHSHDDADFAELLKLQFEKQGIYSWLDTERLKIGQDWQVEIDEGIDNSVAVIVIMTPEARKSEYVTYEWAYAWGKGKKIFPIMLKQTQLHPRLESLQYLDFTNRNTRPFSTLIDEIKALFS